MIIVLVVMLPIIFLAGIGFGYLITEGLGWYK